MIHSKIGGEGGGDIPEIPNGGGINHRGKVGREGKAKAREKVIIGVGMVKAIPTRIMVVRGTHIPMLGTMGRQHFTPSSSRVGKTALDMLVIPKVAK